MYSRGILHVGVLLLVVLVGSAVAQQITGTQLLVSGNGPHAIGGSADPGTQFVIRGNFSGGEGARFFSTLNPAAGDDSYVYNLTPTINKAASGTHPNFFTMRVFPPVISGGSATVNNAATIYIANAPTGATNNHALWIAGGSTELAGTLHVVGDARFDGNIAAKYQDVAEWVPSAHALAGGTVAIIDDRAPNRVVASDKPYDTHVAGVVSTRPGVLLGEGAADKSKVAHSGRVKVKVDARYGAIAIGDLLVTSATLGHAMRSEPLSIGGAQIHRPGTLIGKALEPFATGQGEILVLLTLQ
jgi:hypothetical protein